jgi:hypothetical protein
MKCLWLFFIILGLPLRLLSQEERINRRQFFEVDSPVVIMHLSAHLKSISSKKLKEVRRPAHVKLQLGEGFERKGNIEIRARGNFRFELCYPPPIMLHFNTPGAGSIGGLGKLKMVWGCEDNPNYDQLVLKEYLAYKFYETLTPYSFRVRKTSVYYSDSAKPAKWIPKSAFLIEDIDELAKRMKYREWESDKMAPTGVDREQYILMSIFQFMIGNTDWGLSSGHNIKFIVPKDSVSGIPIAIPFDFDFSGLVDAPYASTPEHFPISYVKERFYMGIIPDKIIIEKNLDLFIDKKAKIFTIIYNCVGLDDVSRVEVLKYITAFYNLIENRQEALKIFMNPIEIKSK